MRFPRYRWNFYRIHLAFFTIHPLIWSAIFYAARTHNDVSFTDSLFLCFSAQTVTGLSTVNLSSLTGFQQAILFWLMVTGDATTVSWVMVLVRRYYFVRKCAHVIRKRKLGVDHTFQRFRTRTIDALAFWQHTDIVPASLDVHDNGIANEGGEGSQHSDTKHTKYSVTDPSHTPTRILAAAAQSARAEDFDLSLTYDPRASSPTALNFGESLKRTVTSSSKASHRTRAVAAPEPELEPAPLHTSPLIKPSALPADAHVSPRVVGFAPGPTPGPGPTARPGADFPRTTTGLTNRSGAEFLRTTTGLTDRSRQTTRSGKTSLRGSASNAALPANAALAPRVHTAEQGFGGFPTPLTLGARLVQQIAPNTYKKVQRTLTLQSEERVMPLHSHRDRARLEISAPLPLKTSEAQDYATTRSVKERMPVSAEARIVTGESDSADDIETLQRKMRKAVQGVMLKIGRNSFFYLGEMTDEELEEVGGVEFGAIRVLTWLVPAYFIGTQLVVFVVFTAYLKTQHKYDSVFTDQIRLVPVPWYAAFQAVSAYTGGGLSLVDTGMVPFIGAYPLVIALGWLIVAGNMLMPVSLRAIVWIIYHCLPASSRQTRQYYKFLLDHPRRCFLYLFPAHQTWFLIVVFFFLTFVEWGGFLVLNIGLEVYESIPTGQRVLAGLFQSFGVRASGFSIVSLGSLAPACKFLYIIMMYIAAYPIAMSVRSTNVYEERSLGVFNQQDEEDEAEPQGEVFSKYLGWHVRRQLSFDLWWLAAALLIIAIIERANIMNPDNDSYFNQFTLMFEIVSAYATVGLSLGIPTENYSLSGALKTGSKLIIIAVMLRGRHRDLPVAIDRAILLPEEFSKSTPDQDGRHVMHENFARELEDEASMIDPHGPPVSLPRSPVDTRPHVD